MKRIFYLCAMLLPLSFCACGQEAPWQAEYAIGLEAMESADYDAAIAAFCDALASDDTQADIYLALHEAYLAQNDPVAAIKVLYDASERIDQAALSEKQALFWENYAFAVHFSDAVDSPARHTLPAQAGVFYESEKYTVCQIILRNRKTAEEYPVDSIGLQSDGDWDFVESDISLTRHEDTLLINLYYGAGQNDLFLYSLRNTAVTELGTYLTDAMYQPGYPDGSEDFILAATQTYDIYDYAPLLWFDWSGQELHRLDAAQYCMDAGQFYYILREEGESGLIYSLYSADLDGENAVYLHSIRENAPQAALAVYFSGNGTLCYEWTDASGEQNMEEIAIGASEEINVP